MISFTKIFEFSSSHTLTHPAFSDQKNLEIFGKCVKTHGHNYRLEVEITGKVDPQTKMIIHSGILTALVKETIIDQVDHLDLNQDVPWLKGVMPTTEGLVEAFWDRLEAVLTTNHPGVNLKRLSVWENRNIGATRVADRS